MRAKEVLAPATLFAIFVACSGLALRADAQEQLQVNKECYRCICNASTHCNLSVECVNGYCGPFLISLSYWIDAGSPTVQGGRTTPREEAYRSCTKDFSCAERTVELYTQKFLKDCNRDGNVNCLDAALIHKRGGYNCQGEVVVSDGYYAEMLSCAEGLR